MQRRSIILSAVLAGALAVGTVPALLDSAPASAATKTSAVHLLNALTVKKETHAASYDRDKFKHWVDANGDCENTRAEVLITESKTRTTGKCTVKTGKWVSLYDGKTVKTASKLDIDHMVPLAEAWRSGAWKWSAKKREAYANDLGYSMSLVAVTAHSNRSKGDKDLSEWLPSDNKCTYVKAWVSVKYRWNLSIDKAEKKTAKTILRRCGSTTVAKPGSPKVGVLVTASAAAPPPVAPAVAAAPTISPSTPATPTSVKLTCPTYGGPFYIGDPSYNLYVDADSDGIVCESSGSTSYYYPPDTYGSGTTGGGSSSGTGYTVTCKDGTISHSGGKQGACSGHGGVR